MPKGAPQRDAKMSARKPRCGPRNRGITLINEREPARKPAFAMLERKPKQKELLLCRQAEL
jgi:hypothetical protein